MQPIGIVADEILSEVLERTDVKNYDLQLQQQIVQGYSWGLTNSLYEYESIGQGTIHIVTGFPDRCVYLETVRHLVHLLIHRNRERATVISQRTPRILVERIVAAISGLGMSDIESRAYSRAQWSMIVGALTWLRDVPIHICDPRDLSSIDFLEQLARRSSLSQLVWIDSIQESSWTLEWEDSKDAADSFFLELGSLHRLLDITTLVSATHPIRPNEMTLPVAYELLPGDGVAEEVATFLETVELHLPDDLGFTTDSYVECRVQRNRFSWWKPCQLVGWDEATQELAEVHRRFTRYSQADG